MLHYASYRLLYDTHVLRLKCEQGASCKFWEGRVEGNVLTVRYGKIGTKGQTRSKELASEADALAALERKAAEKRKKGYVDEPGEATPRSMYTYGLFPGDWYEGANCGHGYEIKFQRVPDATSKQRIAEAYERTLADGPAEPAREPWYWSESWALLYVGQRWDVSADAMAEPFETFSAMADLFDKLNEVAAIAEVIFWGARELDEDEAEEARDEPPSDGPEYPNYSSINDDLFGRKRDSSLPKGAVDEAFEQARAMARPIHDASRSDLAPSRPAQPAGAATDEVVCEPGDLEGLTSAPRLPDRILDQFRVGIQTYRWCPDGSIVLVHGQGRESRFYRAQPEQDAEPVEGFVFEPVHQPVFSLHPDGQRALVVAKKSFPSHWEAEVCEVDLTNGECARLLQMDAWLTCAMYAGNDRIAYLISREKLVLCKRDGGSLEPLSELPVNRTNLESCLDGRALALWGGSGLVVYGVYGDELRCVADDLSFEVDHAWAEDGRLFCAIDARRHEVINLPTAYERHADGQPSHR